MGDKQQKAVGKKMRVHFWDQMVLNGVVLALFYWFIRYFPKLPDEPFCCAANGKRAHGEDRTSGAFDLAVGPRFFSSVSFSRRFSYPSTSSI